MWVPFLSDHSHIIFELCSNTRGRTQYYRKPRLTDWVWYEEVLSEMLEDIGKVRLFADIAQAATSIENNVLDYSNYNRNSLGSERIETRQMVA